jgi:hypothetical protein
MNVWPGTYPEQLSGLKCSSWLECYKLGFRLRTPQEPTMAYHLWMETTGYVTKPHSLRGKHLYRVWGVRLRFKMLTTCNVEVIMSYEICRCVVHQRLKLMFRRHLLHLFLGVKNKPGRKPVRSSQQAFICVCLIIHL